MLEYLAAASLEPNFIVLPPDMTLIHHSKAAALVFSHLDADVASVSPCVKVCLPDGGCFFFFKAL